MSCTHLPTPPMAKKVPHPMELHQDVRTDNYFWMKERDSKDVIDHLRAENAYTEKVMEKSKALQEKLFHELKSRIKEDDSTAPVKIGSHLYYVRFEAGKEYAIYCRKGLEASAHEEILLDGNQLAKGEKYFQISSMKVSPNEKLIAYGVDTIGRRFYTLKIKDLQSGLTLEQQVPNTTGNFVWANDNQTLFLSQQNPETLRSEKVLRFDSQNGDTTELFFEKDELFNVGVSKSLNKKYIFIGTGSFDSSEYLYLDADRPYDTFKVFLPREKKHEYSLYDGEDGFYVLTNWKAENFRVMKAPHNSHDKKNWKEVVSHDPRVFIEGLEVFKSSLALQERTDGLTRIRIINRKSGESQLIKFPDATYTVGLGNNVDYDSNLIRYDYESMVSPPATFDYDVASGESKLIKRKEVPTYDQSKYSSERVWATGRDGTKIPISLLYKKDFTKNASNPILVYGYGSYGYSMDPDFRSSVISLVDRGFVFAVAHIRGGSELGRAWYEAGRMMHKMNTFTDFIDCTEFLIQNKYASPKKVYAMGGSAGGLLMGTVMNLRPDLYNGIVAQVPFVDVLTTMLDTSIPLTTAEYEQWGNPNEQPAYEYIKKYSPYDNIEAKPYPNLLVTTGYHDSQVQYWEPAKWVAKLRDFSTSKNLILLKTDMDSGHGGASGRFESLKDWAFDYAFFLKLEGEQ